MPKATDDFSNIVALPPTVTRRAILRAAPALALVPPAALAVSHSDPLVAMERRFQECVALCNGSEEDEDVDRHGNEASAIMKRMVKMPATSADGLHAKCEVVRNYFADLIEGGEFDGRLLTSVLADAERLAGV